MIKKLSGEQVAELESAYTKTKKPRELLRFQALLLLAQGYKRKEVAQIIRVSTHAIEDWLTAFRKEGIQGLYEKGQPGNHRKLTKEQKERIRKIIITKLPKEVKLTEQFWTPLLVAKLITNTYGISYSPEQCRQLLHQAGLSFHKPEKVNQRQKTGDRLRFEETLKKDSETGKVEVIRWYW